MSILFSKERLVDYFWLLEVVPTDVDVEKFIDEYSVTNTQETPIDAKYDYNLICKIPEKSYKNSYSNDITGKSTVIP